MGLSAIDSIQRGLVGLRANWELILAQWVQTVAVVLLTVAGFVPPLLALGVSVSSLGWDPAGWQRTAAEIAAQLGAMWTGLAVAAVATLVIWLLALVVYCFFQAGIFGVLVAGDRQAPPAARDWRWFRTFSWSNLGGWGGRYLWRFFWFFNLFFAVLLAIALLVALVAVLAVLGGQRWGGPAAVGIGCGGALPALFAFVAAGLWFGLAQADLAREGSGVRVAARRGLEILGRRLGGVLLVYLLMLVASFGLGMVFTPFSFGLDIVLRGDLVARAAATVVLMLLQWFLSAAISVAFGATLVALVRSEGRAAAPPAPAAGSEGTG